METLAMSKRERRRLEVFSQVKSEKLSLGSAGELLGVSYRQVKRLWSRYQSVGDAGLIHGLRGRKSSALTAMDIPIPAVANTCGITVKRFPMMTRLSSRLISAL